MHAKGGQPELKQFAERVLPTLQEHLGIAQRLDRRMTAARR